MNSTEHKPTSYTGSAGAREAGDVVPATYAAETSYGKHFSLVMSFSC